MEYHRGENLFSLAHIVEVVGRHRVAYPGDDILSGVAHLDFVDQIRFGKYCAPGGNLSGVGGAEGIISDLLHLNAQAFCLAGEKSPGARGAEGIHGVVHRDTVFHQNDLGVLPADLQNCADIRVKGGGAHRMGGNLVFHHSGPDDNAYQFSGAAGGAGGHDLETLLVKLAFQEPDQFFHCADRISLGPNILAAEDAVVFVDDNAFGGDRPHVNAQICVFQLKEPSFS